MTAILIEGKPIAEEIRKELRERISSLKDKGVVPGLAVILVGDDAASQTYVRMKGRASEELGMYSQTIFKPNDFPEEDLLELIDDLNADPRVHGILVQLPLPPHIDERKVLVRIDQRKDVDAFHPVNVGKILIGDHSGFMPATPYGIQELLIRSGNSPSGKHVVILGRSNIVGKPLAAMLMQKDDRANATVTVCHSKTENLAEITRTADILVSAMGAEAAFVKADMVKPGAVVIDVGSNRVPDASLPRGYRLMGDVDFDSVRQKAAAITPVPGGVGPMTIVMLMRNTVKAAETMLEQPHS
ncbi:MAG TPA: tetrahydrofolate dehydrogenase/cyclohydrolase catalytic domain-containing protein [Methanomassiliicoccales archaeon]|jgi:methylenetetrahydrofolate dehydrogenase (NADP+)/methenyltetrahydrofolate cyclohydrolase